MTRDRDRSRRPRLPLLPDPDRVHACGPGSLATGVCGRRTHLRDLPAEQVEWIVAYSGAKAFFIDGSERHGVFRIETVIVTHGGF